MTSLSKCNTWELNGWNFVQLPSMPDFSKKVLLLRDENSSIDIGTLEIVDEKRQWYVNGELYRDVYDFNFWIYVPANPRKIE